MTPHCLEVPNAILLGAVRDALHEGRKCIINVRGWSMRPFLENRRDNVLLSPADAPKVGDAVLAEISPDHYVLHRIISIEGEDVVLMGDGNILGTENCRLNNIHGVVIEYRHPWITFRSDNGFVIMLVRLWRRLLPIRPYLLRIYSILRKLNIA